MDQGMIPFDMDQGGLNPFEHTELGLSLSSPTIDVRDV